VGAAKPPCLYLLVFRLRCLLLDGHEDQQAAPKRGSWCFIFRH
jgi:hypothetical protein